MDILTAMANAENQTYVWACQNCEFENTDTRRTSVTCENCGHEYDHAPGTGSTNTESPIRVDLNGPFTEEEVRQLLGSVEDDHAWTLVITYAAQAYFLDFHANQEKLGLGGSGGEVDLNPKQFMKGWDADIERDERLLAEKSDKVYLRFETYGIGTGYVGPESAADDRHVRGVYNDLKRHWSQKPKGVGFVGEM